MFSSGLEISHQWKFCHHQKGQFFGQSKSHRVPKFWFLSELRKKSFVCPKKSRWQFSRFYLNIEVRQNWNKMWGVRLTYFFILCWFPILSVVCWNNWEHLTFILKFQSFQSKRSLLSGVSFSTRTIQRSQKVKTQKLKTQKVKVAGFCNCSHSHSETHATIAVKKLTGSSSSRPLLFSSLCPKSLLTEARKASSLGPSCCPRVATPELELILDPFGRGRRLSSQLLNIEPYEQGTPSTDKEDVDEHVVADGDLFQEDLSTWRGTTSLLITSPVAHSAAPPLHARIWLLSSSNIQE